MNLVIIILSPLWWLIKTLSSYFFIVVSLTTLLRTTKTLWGRRNKRLVKGTDAVLITGATSGIGLALSKYVYRLGYSLIACYYDSQEPGFNELLAMGKSSSRRRNQQQQVILIKMDVRKEDSIRSAHENCMASLAEHKLKLYAVINNAGLGSLQPFGWLERRKMIAILETNLLGCLLVSRQFLANLIESKGRLINVSSGLAFVPGPGYLTYGLTKTALVYFNHCINMELKKRYGLQSIVIAPQNLIKNTNIAANNHETCEQAWISMSDLERRIYKNEYEDQKKLAKRLENATKEHSKASPTSHSPVRRTRGLNRSEDGWSKFLSGLRRFLKSAQGVNQAKTLEESGLLECFEDALRLETPNEIIFAGDSVFSFFFGSLMLSIPPSCIQLFGPSISQSLYQWIYHILRKIKTVLRPLGAQRIRTAKLYINAVLP